MGLTLTSRVSGSDDASFIGFRIHLFRVGILVGFWLSRETWVAKFKA